MKLVDILARELKVWPDCWRACAQEINGLIAGFTTSALTFDGLSGWYTADQGTYIALSRDVLGKQEMADDWRKNIVTRAEWQAAVDALKAPKEKVMDIDWSKAPEGATHFDTAGYRTKSFMKLESGAWYFWPPMSNKPRWSYWGEDTADADTGSFVPRPTTADWNGEGLPPVGVTCEVRSHKTSGVWVAAKIIAHITNDPRFNPIAVYLVAEDPSAIVSQAVASNFRPIRTPEQIAAEERESAIDEMVKSKIAGGLAPWVCGELYDAGYRKFEIVEGEE